MLKHLLFSASLFLAQVLQGQIVTGTMSPNYLSYSTQNLGSYYDLNNDGTYDFYIWLKFNTSTGDFIDFIVQGLNGSLVEVDNNNSNLIMGFNSGVNVGNNTFVDSSHIRAGYFPNSTIRYAGIKLQQGGHLHCGYISFYPYHSSSSPSLDLYGYGYQTDTSLCITTGAIANSTRQLLDEKVVNAFQQSGVLYIQPSIEETYSVRLFDLTGKTIATYFNQSGNTQFPLDFPQSSFIVVVTIDKTQKSKTFHFAK